ncbi:GNAT family N-acetyltransferase [Pendulispora brunnea]|uniref:GNAT family N-acetyltransferase n=1 Tax=Pendulispora brunnea TaxID=2905690 RepID=A0ABZ2KAS6_9BACT
MRAFELLVTDSVDPDAEAVIDGGLADFNDEATGYSDRRALAVTVKDPTTGKIVGGAIGRSSLGLLFLDLFYLPKTLRGEGLGTKILHLFEEEGRKRGCRSAVLYTISFQAPGFYERNGWRAFGEVPCAPPGTSRVFMTKEL